jgi:hypothetical protein
MNVLLLFFVKIFNNILNLSDMRLNRQLLFQLLLKIRPISINKLQSIITNILTFYF